VAEATNVWHATSRDIDGVTSLGVHLDDLRGFPVKTDPRDLRKYLYKQMQTKREFAVLYEFPMTSEYNHCVLVSSKGFSFGNDYTIKHVKKPNHQGSKTNAIRRICKTHATDIIRKSLQIDDVETAAYQTTRTAEEVSFALRLEKARILKTSLPDPFPVRTMLGALILTRGFKSKFPSFWLPDGEALVQSYAPVRAPVDGPP
jgi:hypothetical protein